jgi:hypothetical protein
VNIPDKIMGGVITFKNEHYEQVNGFSNEYEGWGKEDDDLYLRCERENLIPYKHLFGRYYSIPHKLRAIDEKNLHEKNGKRYGEFLEGKFDNKNDGICSISNYKINEVININSFTKHYKIKYA